MINVCILDTFQQAEKEMAAKRRRHPKLSDSMYNITMQEQKREKAATEAQQLGKELKKHKKVSFIKNFDTFYLIFNIRISY